MLIYKRIDVSEGIDFNNTDKSKECIICHYWFFKDKNFNFKNLVCNDCHDISVMCNVVIIKILQYLK